MPRYAITGPDRMRYDWLVAPDPLTALYRLHLEALGADRVRLLEDVITFIDPRDQELCAGRWKVTQCGLNGSEHTVVITIVPPVPGEPDFRVGLPSAA
jgi:hypothetical protein